MANQVDFKILPSDQFNVYSPQTRSEKIITYFTLLSKLRGDILAVSSQDDPNNIVSAYYSNVGNTQTLHLVKADGSEVTASNSFAGTVTSVDMSVPTGFAISGNPITTSGTLNVSFASGYSLPTNALQATWTTAYNRSITSAEVTGTSTKTLTLNQQDGGTITASWSDIDTGLTSVGLSMPSAFAVANSPLTVNGTIAVTGAGTSAQYIRGDGQLANFPNSGGGGSTINYYLNGSVNQGTFGGTTYYEMSKTPIAGAGTNFTRTSAQGPGYIASFITDAGDPALLNVPGGNWNLEIYFNSSSSGGGPSFYGELYKVSSSNVFTLIASNSANPENITNGTTVDQYFTSIAVPQTTLLATDRLAVRLFVTPDGRDITLHTEDNNFCEVITTFSTGLNALNGLTAQVQYFATGTSGTDFNIDSVTDTHTFNLPTASATNRGALSSADWTTFNSKASDAFKTIAVAGQSNVVADSATDTLTFEAGSNIVITTDAATDKITITAVGGGSGSVTSVDMSVPTGFAISGNPITTSGTLALAFASGYSLPTTASQANWNTAYNDSITAFSYNTSTGVLTLTQQDAGTLTATVTLQPFTTDNLTQGSTNLYDKVVSLTGAGTTVVTGTYPSFTITSNDQHVGTVTSVATTAPITGGTITSTGTIGITQSGTASDGYLSSTDWNTFNARVAGSGTINYVSKWTSTGAIGNSQIFDSGTYVGINTASPAAKLDISGAHVASIGLLRLNASASNVAAQTYYIDGAYKAATYAGTDDNFYILGRDADIVFSTTSSATARMTISNGGNVGIGTNAPTQKLMVSGAIRVTGGYYDSSNSIGSNGQVLASTGTGTTWINASGGTVNGSGTVNYLSKWTGTTLLADSIVYDNGTNVGVGTASPGQKVDVVGASAADTYLRVLGGAGTTKGGIIVGNNDSGKNYGSLFFDNANNNVYLYQQYSSGDLVLGTNTNEKMRITSAGNVGIGNTNPTQKLHVEGNIRVTGAYYDSSNGAGSSGQVLSSTGSGTSWITPFSGSGTTNYVAKWTSGTALGNSQIFDNGTNVGIGTATPSEKLSVSGNINVVASTGSKIGFNTTDAFAAYSTSVAHYGISYGWNTNPIALSGYFGVGVFTSGTERMRIDGSGFVGIGTTSPSRLLHVAGNAQVDGWLFQDGYYSKGITLPSPSANYGNGRIYLRLCSSASGRIMTAKVRISSTWNWAPAFGSVEADISFYWTGSSLAYSYVNILSATGQAATNLTFGPLEVEGGSISVPVYSTNSNPIFTYIQLSPDADPSQVSYSTWSSVSFPGQSNVYVQTSLGVGTTSPSALLHVNGTFRSNAFFTLSNGISYWGPNGVEYGYLTWDTGYARVGASGSNTLYLGGSNQITILSGGNVGIGETTPSQKLHVTGSVRVSGAYYDSANAAGTSGQILSSTGTGTAWISPGGGGGIITGSGTTNYVTKWTSGTAVGNSSIYDNGYVGIGTTAPAVPFEIVVNSSVGVTGNVYFLSRFLQDKVNYRGPFFGYDTSGSIAVIGAESAGPASSLAFYTYSSGWGERMRISGTNVGIGTTDPNYKVVSDGSGNAFMYAALSSAIGTVGNWVGYLYGYTGSTYQKGATIFESIDGNGRGKFHIALNNAANNTNVSLSDSKLTVLSDGNVGIGTTNPLKKLVVTTGNNTNSSNHKSDALAYFGGGNDNPDAQNISFPNPSITDNSITGMHWWSADVMFGRYKNEAFWSIKETHGGSLGNSQRDIIRCYFYDSGGYNYIDKTVIPSGNVGIGTTAPGAKLDVDGSILLSETGRVQGRGYPYDTTVGAGADASTSFIEAGSTAGYRSRIALAGGNATDPNTIKFSTASSERMRITSAGNVGIGITSVSARLSIASVDGSNDEKLQRWVYYAPTPTDYYLDLKQTVTSAVVRYNFSMVNAGTAYNDVLVLDRGNVGIGTTDPSQKLHVSGNIRVTGAYYDSANGAGTSGQILSSTGTGTAWIAAPSGGVTGSGTTNYVTKWTSGSAVGNSQIFDNGTSVGIGTTAPSDKLHVAGGILASFGSTNGYVSLQPGNATVQGYVEWWKPGPARVAYMGYNDGVSANNLGLTLENSANLIINGGNVGINTTAPAEKLAVVGNIRSAGDVIASVGLGYGNYISMRHDDVNGYITITRTVNAGHLILQPYGNVGINTTSPAYKLDVIGSVRSYSGLISNGYHADTYIENLLPAANNGAAQGDVQLRMWCSEPGITWSWAGFGYNVKNDGASPYGFGRVNTSFGQAYMRMSTDGDWYFYNTNTSGTRVTTMTLTNAGNVGIGTTAPESLLHLSQASAGGDGAFLFIDNPASSTLGNTAGIRFATNAGASFSGYGSFIQAVNTNAGNGAESLTFGTWNGASRGERMRILDNGNVGIGTTAPLSNLHITTTAQASVPSAGTGAVKGLYVSNDLTTYGMMIGSIASGNGYIQQQRTDSATYYNLLLQPNGGNVGIGTTGPANKLDVRGIARILSDDAINAKILYYTPYPYGMIFRAYGSGANSIQVQREANDAELFPLVLQPNGSNVGIGITAPLAKLHVQAPTSSTEPSLFVQSGTSGVYGMIAASDAYHGLIMRGIPSSKDTYGVTAQDSMSFFEYGGDFRFYTKGASFQLDAQINGGTGRFRGDVVAYYSFSDERLKDDVKPLENSLDKVLALQGVSYKWNLGERKGQSDIGLIAQQVEKVVPEVVREKTNIDGDTFKSVNYEHLVGVLIEAIKEQQKQIDELKSKLK